MLLDEACPKMVAKLKVLFQASNGASTLGSTNTNMYSYRKRLYRIRIIICSNKWHEELELVSEEDKKWIMENSIVQNVWPGFFQTPGL